MSTNVRSIEDLVDEVDDDTIKEQTKNDAENSSFQDRGSLSGNDLLRPCPKRKGSSIFYREGARHWVKDTGNGKGTYILCVAKMKAAGRCYYCEAIAAAKRVIDEREDSKTYKEIDGQKSRSGAWWNMIDMKAPERGAKVYWLPFTVHKEIKAQTGIADGDVQERPWDIVEGFPLKITRDKDNTYTVRLMRKKAEELDPECYLGMADLEETARALMVTPKELFAYAYVFAKNYGVLDEVDWEDVPYLKAAASSNKKRKRSEDEDDDYELPKSKRKGDDDDEDYETPKSKRRRDEDEEEEAPKKTKRKIEVDDEDVEVEVEIIPPTKKKKKGDDDDAEPPRKRKVVDVEPKKKSKKKSEYDASDDDDPFGDDDD